MAAKAKRARRKRAGKRHPNETHAGTAADPAPDAVPAATAQVAPTRLDDSLVGRLSAAIEAHQAGDQAAAEQGYRETLEAVPDHPHALHYLGVVLHQKGENDEAVRLIERAVAQMPNHADMHSNLGAVFYEMERLEKAAEHFRHAADLNPGLAEAHSNLAAVLDDMGETEAAIESYQAAHLAKPEAPKFIKRLGDLYLEHRQYAEAIDQFDRFLSFAPDDAEVHNNMGYAHEQLSDLEAAEGYYRRASELYPDSPEINNNLGSVLHRLKRFDEAQDYFARALECDPDKWEDLAHMAGALTNRGDIERAIPIYEQLLESQPDNAQLHNDFGAALANANNMVGAEENFRRAIELDPEYAEAHNNLGSALMNMGRRGEAIESYKKTIRVSPRHLSAHINICLALTHQGQLAESYLYAQATVLLENYRPTMFTNPHKVFRAVCAFDDADSLGDPWDLTEQIKNADYSANFLDLLVLADTEDKNERLAKLHRSWGRETVAKCARDPLPERKPHARRSKIRLGLVSSDLRQHSVAKFVKPLLEYYDSDSFEVFCYSPSEDPHDPVQKRIKELVTEFKVVKGKREREIAEEVQKDDIDILFELNGFTKDSLLSVMAYKAAPVQIYWLGYPFTTGLPTMDYIILDEYVKPVNDGWLAETPLLMPECWVCFEKFAPEPISERLPFERNGTITFGSQNNPYKYSRDTIALWSKVLQRVPDSRFIFVRPEFGSAILVGNLIKEFEKHGIGAERLYFVNSKASPLSHFAFYDEIDITLDTFPLTGGTTTCDAMWMGVPVISLVGANYHQRLSYSLLSNTGLGDLCVKTPDAFVDKAVSLAEDPARLRRLRHGLRPALLESPLGDGERYAHDFQAILHDVARKHELR